jgi:hypothetical protein
LNKESKEEQPHAKFPSQPIPTTQFLKMVLFSRLLSFKKTVVTHFATPPPLLGSGQAVVPAPPGRDEITLDVFNSTGLEGQALEDTKDFNEALCRYYRADFECLGYEEPAVCED